MDSSQILSELNKIFVTVLENEDIKLENSTSAADIDEWDSLSHLQLVYAVERHFKIRFTTSEIQKWSTVGELAANIEAKLKG